MSMKIPLAVPDISEDESLAVAEVLKSGWLTQGPKTIEFETALKNYFSSGSVYCVSSCTTGLFLVLKACGIGAGDEVIVPSYSFIATANVVTHANATPVFADINATDINLSVEATRAAITSKTKAVILVHQAGFPANIAAFRKLCDEKGLILIEDAACAIGSKYENKTIGGHSDFVVFSFHPRKILTTGEGGAIAYNGSDPKIQEYLNISRKHGMSVNDLDRHLSNKVVIETYPICGFNYRMTDIQAAIGLVQLKKLDQLIQKRRSAVKQYQEQLDGLKSVELFTEQPGTYANYQTLLLRVKEKYTGMELMEKLLQDGISTRRGIMAAHLEKCYSHLKNGNLENTESRLKQSIVLPLFSSMTLEQVSYVAGKIKSYF